MSAFADTSFLCALYREQDNSHEADRLMRKEAAPVQISSLVLFEFRQSARLQVFRFSQDRAQGYAKREAQRMMDVLTSNLGAGQLHLLPVDDWAKVYSLAEELSAQHTTSAGYRSFDILHVATALYLQAGRFLTFDARQAALAKTAGLKIKP